ncbi:MAG: N-acetyltransferase [Candidatus Abyssobacteria bacterium SURF_5]|uniref:N-acetyltransferase n=1 Tax=Abyssobacteria bacterium (strain SURF_5) TaxID=2093360 RepID=A0A3A4NYM1_ABYX5|nr:MAG: N-acetyltransferase [Candidatus Abyssubacteria bacterium SURF_5]
MSLSGRAKYYYLRLREEYSENGLLDTGTFVCSSAIRKAFLTNSSTWYRLELRNCLPLIKPRVAAQFDFMDLEQATEYFRNRHVSFPWMFSESELEVAAFNGHKFPCFLVDGAITAYLKVGISNVYVFDYKQAVHLAPATAIFYDGFVEPSYRCKGLGAAILSATAAFLKEAGFHTVWAQIPAWNVASIRMTLNAGFEPVGEARYFRVLGREFLFNRPKSLPLRLGSFNSGGYRMSLEESTSQQQSVKAGRPLTKRNDRNP